MKTKLELNSVSFIGKYEITVLGDGRIILPTDVIQQLKNHNTKRLLPSKIPGLKALVLCPETHWNQWIYKLKREFPCLKTNNGARTFFVPWKPIIWDSKGRITLPRRAREYVELKPCHAAIILGNHLYFELWSEEEYTKITRECEATLHESIQR